MNSQNQVLFSTDDSKQNNADVLMVVSGVWEQSVTITGRLGTRFEMFATVDSEEAAIELLQQKASELQSDIKVLCAAFADSGNRMHWEMKSDF